MTKLKAIAIIFLFAQFASSQELDLKEHQQKRYIREKLTIEVKGMATGTYNEYSGLGMMTSWRKWQAYKGFQAIPEAYFFYLAGYEKESIMAKKYKKNTDYMFGGGILLFVAGSIFLAAGLTNSDGEDFGLVMVGSASYIFGISLFYGSITRSRKNWAPCALAYDIAEEYNKTLMLRIKGEF